MNTSIPPGSPGTDRSSELLADLAALRERHRVSMRKCEAPSEDERPSKKRAKKVYRAAVMAAGGSSAVATEEQRDESTVRYRVEHPKRFPHLEHVYDMPARGMRVVIDDLLDALEEKLGGARRAG